MASISSGYKSIINGINLTFDDIYCAALINTTGVTTVPNPPTMIDTSYIKYSETKTEDKQFVFTGISHYFNRIALYIKSHDPIYADSNFCFVQNVDFMVKPVINITTKIINIEISELDYSEHKEQKLLEIHPISDDILTKLETSGRISINSLSPASSAKEFQYLQADLTSTSINPKNNVILNDGYFNIRTELFVNSEKKLFFYAMKQHFSEEILTALNYTVSDFNYNLHYASKYTSKISQGLLIPIGNTFLLLMYTFATMRYSIYKISVDDFTMPTLYFKPRISHLLSNKLIIGLDNSLLYIDLDTKTFIANKDDPYYELGIDTIYNFDEDMPYVEPETTIASYNWDETVVDFCIPLYTISGTISTDYYDLPLTSFSGLVLKKYESSEHKLTSDFCTNPKKYLDQLQIDNLPIYDKTLEELMTELESGDEQLNLKYSDYVSSLYFLNYFETDESYPLNATFRIHEEYQIYPYKFIYSVQELIDFVNTMQESQISLIKYLGNNDEYQMGTTVVTKITLQNGNFYQVTKSTDIGIVQEISTYIGANAKYEDSLENQLKFYEVTLADLLAHKYKNKDIKIKIFDSCIVVLELVDDNYLISAYSNTLNTFTTKFPIPKDFIFNVDVQNLDLLIQYYKDSTWKQLIIKMNPTNSTYSITTYTNDNCIISKDGTNILVGDFKI